MDEAKRAELHARRAAILAEKERQDWVRHRAEFVAMVPILTALEDAGDDYDSTGYRSLGWRLSHWAHDPHRWAIREESCTALPLDPAPRNAAILAALRQRLGEDDPVTIVIRREELVLTLRMPVLVRHLDVLIDNGEGDKLAFAAPPADWIVSVDRRLAIPVNEIVTGELPEYPA